jgi:phosphoribosylanthranilate isomerase
VFVKICGMNSGEAVEAAVAAGAAPSADVRTVAAR